MWCESHPQNHLGSIVIIEDTAELILELCVDLLGNHGQRELLVHHHRPVHLNSKQPW